METRGRYNRLKMCNRISDLVFFGVWVCKVFGGSCFVFVWSAGLGKPKQHYAPRLIDIEPVPGQ